LIELTDILTKEDWSKFEKALFDRFKINSTVYDASGKGITGKPNWCNRLCPEVKANQESLAAICATGNQNFMAQAKQSKKPVIGECDAGLIKIAVPIFISGEFMGIAGGCGLLPAGGEVETFLIEKTMRMSKEQVTQLCDGLGDMTDQQAKEMAMFIEKRIARYVTDYRH